jgi:HipA-like protein
MLNKLFERVHLFFQSEDQEVELSTPVDSIAEFELKYQDLVIGILSHQDGQWVFSYSETFKNQNQIRTIVDFPDKDKVYQSTTLFPFFSSRIPSLQRLKIQDIIPKNFSMDEIGLLKKFGKQSITNPYQLIANH